MNGLAVVLGLLGFGWLTLFQLLLSAGAPIGRLAWGGVHRVLPKGLRVASLASALLTFLAVMVVLQAGRFVSILPEPWITPLLWAFAVFFAASFLLNLLGAKGWERLHGVPLTLICTGSCAILALS
ncbi:MAG: hypothetical protein AAF340_07550 [Pseudomonadota bacterium]